MKNHFLGKFFLLLLCASTLFSKSTFDSYFVGAGKQYGIPPLLLKNIAKIESGLNPNAIGLNKNGTKDYGLMQINTIHLKRLHKEYGITEQMIMHPKTNIYAAAELLSKIIRKHGLNFEAIGRYHSNTEEFKSKWNDKLTKELIKSLQKPNSKI
jgi:soluble lytic murein transglycosylase-like protein